MNIGLVLSGGGVRGVAHIGAIKALEEFGIYPKFISGTSAGAIVAGLYAGGVDWSEVLHFFKTVPIFHTNRYALNKPGFIDTEKFYSSLKQYLPEDDFKALHKELYITATNVLNGTLKIFNSGELIRPILASASFPGVFSPVQVNDDLYIDGGTIDNFPVEVLQPHCDKIIGVYVNPLMPIKKEDLKHSYDVADRAYKIMVSTPSLNKFNDCDIVIVPEELADYGTFDMNNIDVIFNIGYETTKKMLQENEQLRISLNR